ncbi:hypothetical protein SZN_36047 [Streptomyces zinciresistens K42]|uniref:GPP34 family phosphoprotein n=1 Tax=Streptomyces zinciresistens K42 TaxID=700597 RepID=G2GNV4_9ACTN|nr:GPP34 family phosphoprotein [Streptomyces zinciresistens]EGX54816.1 hypothetical protein SZN_36047 [Streptomyces zinciresistens K42]
MDKDLLLVEDLTLLMFDDASGAIAGAGTLYYTLGGAVLVELARTGRVEIDERDRGLNGPRVRAVAGEPLSDPLLRAAHAKVAARPRGVQTLLVEIGTGLRETVLDRLVERGLVRRERRTTLGVFRTTAWRAADTGHKESLVAEVRAALVDGVEPDTRTAALIGLLSASGTLPSLHRAIPWSGAVYTRAKRLEQASWGAEAVNAAVTRTLLAVSVGAAAAAAATD